MAIEKTGPRSWRFTGKDAKGMAPFFLLATGALLVLALGTVYLAIGGAAYALGVSFWVVFLPWLLLCGNVSINDRRLALLPAPAATAVNWAMLSTAVYGYSQMASWKMWPVALLLTVALVNTVRKLLKTTTAN